MSNLTDSSFRPEFDKLRQVIMFELQSPLINSFIHPLTSVRFKLRVTSFSLATLFRVSMKAFTIHLVVSELAFVPNVGLASYIYSIVTNHSSIHGFYLNAFIPQ
jgi:hypothetical protein